MAADTAAKRYAAMLLLCPWRPLAVLPSGTVDDAERATGLYLYAGLPGAAPPVVLPGGMVVTTPHLGGFGFGRH